MLFSSDWTVKHILKCALYSNLTLCVLNYHYINSIFFRYIFIVYKNEVNIYIYIYFWHYLLWLKEGDPHIVEQLHTILPGKITHIGDECWREENITQQCFLLFFILKKCLGPALLLWLHETKTGCEHFFSVINNTKTWEKKGKINRLSVSRERPATAAKLSSKPSKCNSSAF